MKLHPDLDSSLEPHLLVDSPEQQIVRVTQLLLAQQHQRRQPWTKLILCMER